MSMHTFRYETPIGPDMDEKIAGGEVFFHYHADLSGIVNITSTDAQGERVSEIDVPGEALVEFVAEYVRRHRISTLEDMPAANVLELPSLPNPNEPHG